MKIKKIRTIEYQYGEEEQIKKIIYKSQEPILIKIKNFTDKFTLDYFEKNIHDRTTYSTYEIDRPITLQSDDFAAAIAQIKLNKPHRIFAQILSRVQSAIIESYVPLWQKIPFRPRYFAKAVKTAYFFGGHGAWTQMHFDREHCCNLHLCLSGTKEFLLFTEEQSENLYKEPFIGNSIMDFSQPLETLRKLFPKFNQAEGYKIVLEKGDMLFMPKNCWHFTKYLNASSAASYVFYPKKILQFYGYFTGHFFLGYSKETGYGISEWPIFKKFIVSYAHSTGKKKFLLKIIENILFIFMLPIISVINIIHHKLKPRRVF